MVSLLDSLSAGGLALPLLVFCAELSVVTIGTIRIIFVAQGQKVLAPLLGFFEVSIWLFAIGQIMAHLTHFGCHLAFAAGFTLGNFLGVLLERRLGMGSVVIHLVTSRDAGGLVEGLRLAGYGVTRMEGRGVLGPVQVVFTVVRRRELGKVLALIRGFDPGAFYSVNELRAVAAGVPAARGRAEGLLPAPVWPFRTTA